MIAPEVRSWPPDMRRMPMSMRNRGSTPDGECLYSPMSKMMASFGCLSFFHLPGGTGQGSSMWYVDCVLVSRQVGRYMDSEGRGGQQQRGSVSLVKCVTLS